MNENFLPVSAQFCDERVWVLIKQIGANRWICDPNLSTHDITPTNLAKYGRTKASDLNQSVVMAKHLYTDKGVTSVQFLVRCFNLTGRQISHLMDFNN